MPESTKQAIATIIAKERGKTTVYINTLISRKSHKRNAAIFPRNKELWEKFRDDKIMDMRSIIIAELCGLPIKNKDYITAAPISTRIRKLIRKNIIV